MRNDGVGYTMVNMTHPTRTDISESATELGALATILRNANDAELLQEVTDRLAEVQLRLAGRPA